MNDLSVIEQVLVQGDLAKLSTQHRVEYYNRVCESLTLNPLTRPFQYLQLNGKLILYATKDCTEQLRKRDGISITIVSRELVEGVYVVTARAQSASGRCDESIGAVAIDNLKGEAKANALMKAETKAKRRVTLSFAGLGMLDENEVSSIPDAQVVTMPEQPQRSLPAPEHTVNTETGEILEAEPPRQPRTPENLKTCKDCSATIAWAGTPGSTKSYPYDVGPDNIRTDVRHQCPRTGQREPLSSAPPTDKQRKLLIQRAEAMQRNPKLPDGLRAAPVELAAMADDELREFIAEMAEALNKPVVAVEATYDGVYPTGDGNTPPAGDDGDVPF